MAKIQSEFVFRIAGDGKDDPDGFLHFRNPTNKEMIDFDADTYSVGKRNQMKFNLTPARLALFDKVLIKIVDVTDDAGPITLETKDRIPAGLKLQAMDSALQQWKPEIDVKD